MLGNGLLRNDTQGCEDKEEDGDENGEGDGDGVGNENGEGVEMDRRGEDGDREIKECTVE